MEFSGEFGKSIIRDRQEVLAGNQDRYLSNEGLKNLAPFFLVYELIRRETEADPTNADPIGETTYQVVFPLKEVAIDGEKKPASLMVRWHDAPEGHTIDKKSVHTILWEDDAETLPIFKLYLSLGDGEEATKHYVGHIKRPHVTGHSGGYFRIDSGKGITFDVGEARVAFNWAGSLGDHREFVEKLIDEARWHNASV